MKAFGQTDGIYRSLFESVPCMVWVGRPDGYIEYINPLGLDYLGSRAEEVGGWGWRKLIHAEDASHALAEWDRAVQAGAAYQTEYRMRIKGGWYRWQAVRAQLARGNDDLARKWVGICTDIHDQKPDLGERRRAEEDRARLAAIVESSDDAIVGKTLEGIITSWNAGAQRLFGYGADEMVGQPVSRIIPSDRLGEEVDILARLQRGEHVKHFETVRRRKDGRLIDVSLSSSPIRDGSGRVIGASKIARDVSSRKRAEAAIEQANERLREQAAVLELAPLLVRDLESRIVLWTQGAERLYGFSKEEATGRISYELFRTEFPEPRERVEDQLSRTGRWEGELVHHDRDGKRLIVASQQIVYRGSDGQPAHILETDTNITERKRAEAELNRSQDQLRALTARQHQIREEEAIRIARELHDELGRELTMMKMDVAWIERELLMGGVTANNSLLLREKAGEIKKAIDETVRSVRRISTELRPGALDDLGLAAAIEWQAQDFQKRSGLACVVRIPEEELQIERDQATALFRIFQESLTNVARHAQATRVWVHLAEESGLIVLEVEDDGVGILCAPQATEHRSLGLLGIRERAAAFGGLVEISGVPGRGTTVTVRMPVTKPPVL